MEHRQLGRTGVRVPPLCLGAMNFSDANAEEGIATVRAALDAGITFVDTANVYSRGQSETVVGKAIAGRRDEVVLATKVHGAMSDDDSNARGNSRRHVKMQCEASLRRLGTDRIDLYQLHRADPDTPIDETLTALDDLVREGKVHYVGLSTFPAWQTVEAIAFAAQHAPAARPVCEQPPYNLLERTIEQELLPMAERYGVGIIPWSPLAFGILTGKYAGGVPDGSRLAGQQAWQDKPEFLASVEAAGRLGKVAEAAGLTLLQLSLAWLLAQPLVTAPIIGPKDRDQLAQNLTALDVTLDEDTLAAVDEIVPPGKAVLPLR